MRRSRRRRSTATSMPAGCARSTTTPTRGRSPMQDDTPRTAKGFAVPATRDPDLDRWLLMLGAQRSPRTVDAYRRDVGSLAASRGGVAGEATSDEIERWLAQMRADGLAARPRHDGLRLSAYFKHLVLLGVRADNPAAEVTPPRRPRTLPRTLSPAEAERLVEAAAGITPRAMRDRALVELLYGAGLRVSETIGPPGHWSISTAASSA